jgi:hypothetical protein
MGKLAEPLSRNHSLRFFQFKFLILEAVAAFFRILPRFTAGNQNGISDPSRARAEEVWPRLP